MIDLNKWWPVIGALGAWAAMSIWWAAGIDVQLHDLQTYVDRTAQHLNNVDYSGAP